MRAERHESEDRVWREGGGGEAWRRRWSGVALVAVLSVLTVLAVMASAFAVVLQIELASSSVQMERLGAELLWMSAIEHAKALVRWDEGTSVVGGLLTPPAYTGLVKTSTVRNGAKEVVGRYRLCIEDESGKLNLLALPRLVEGAECRRDREELEGLLGVEGTRGVMKFLLGRDERPGQAWVDDDGNGIVDDADEFDPERPRGDDAGGVSEGDLERYLRGQNVGVGRDGWRVCTVRSRVEDVDDLREPEPVAINASGVRKLAQALQARGSGLGGGSRYMSQLAATLVDYRDENHVVSTHGGMYGVEAVCFNEVLANDGSYICEPYFGRSGIPRDGGMSIEPKEAYVVGLQVDPYYKAVNPLAQYPMRPVSVARRGGDVEVTFTDSPRAHRELTRCLQRRGLADAGGNIRYPKGLWVNAHMIFRLEEGGAVEEDYRVLPRVLESEGHRLVVEGRWGPGRVYDTFETLEALRTNGNARTGFWLDNHWERCWGTYTVHPRVSDWAIVEAPQARVYYRVFVGNQPFTPTGFKGNAPELDCDGELMRESYTEEKLLKWEYNRGEPVRSDRLGFVDIFVTSSRECNYVGWWNREMFNLVQGVNKTKSIWVQAILMRPDIVELINVSDQPVSIANWRVMVNTGSMAKELCRVKGSYGYERKWGGAVLNENAVVEARSYAYLTTDPVLFDRDYGDGSGVWGDKASERLPVVELPAADWGIWYRISGFRRGTRNLWDPGSPPGRDAQIVLEGAQFRPGEMAGEIVMFRSDRNNFVGNNLNGFTRMITGNTRNAIEILYGAAVNADSDIRVGDYAIIYGLPRAGGFVSLTLRNEYGQLTARMTEYGAAQHTDYGYSSSMRDPTVEGSWEKPGRPSIGGREEQARGERRVWERRGTVRNARLKTLADALEVYSRRLDVRFDGGVGARALVEAVGPVVRVGEHVLEFEQGKMLRGEGAWWSTVVTVAVARGVQIGVVGAQWEPDEWAGQTLVVMSGAQKGQRWPVRGNGPRSVTVAGLSVPGGEAVRLVKGDLVAVGPGYGSGMVVTRRSGERGEWEWQVTGIERGCRYKVYVYGLNDGIVTTEFLEENHNARLDVEVWNFAKGRWDKLCAGVRCDKSDGVECGEIGPEHVSGRNEVRLGVIAHELQGRGGSGRAWLDYVVLAPRRERGLINVNTADERVLAALPGVGRELAKALVAARKKRGLRSVYEVVRLPGVEAKQLAAGSRWLTTRGDEFKVEVVAETVNSHGNGGRFVQTAYLQRRRNEEGIWHVEHVQ